MLKKAAMVTSLPSTCPVSSPVSYPVSSSLQSAWGSSPQPPQHAPGTAPALSTARQPPPPAPPTPHLDAHGGVAAQQGGVALGCVPTVVQLVNAGNHVHGTAVLQAQQDTQAPG